MTPSTQLIQHVKFHCPTLLCCRETLPQSLEIQQRGDLREIFCSGQNLNSFQNHLIWRQILRYTSFPKTVLFCSAQFSHSELFNTGHFWAKKICHAILMSPPYTPGAIMTIIMLSPNFCFCCVGDKCWSKNGCMNDGLKSKFCVVKI